MKFRISLVLLCSLFILNLWSQDVVLKPDFSKKFRQLTTKDGLSDNRILDVMQDRYGFLWIASENGLNRYDGYSFLVFEHDEEDSTSLSSNLITSVAEDIYGNLWIGTGFGLNKYNRSQNTFEHYFADHQVNDGLKDNHIRALFADEMGFLWIETVDGHLHQMNIRNNRMVSYKHMGTSQPYYHYHSIFKQNDTSIWVGGRNQQVQRFNPQTETFQYYRNSNSHEFGKRVNDVSFYFEDSEKQMWVCGLDGAYQFEPESGAFELFLKGSTFCMFEESRNDLWFGTGNGIYIYNRLKKELNHIISDLNNPHSLSNRNINKIIQDRSGVIWVATNEGLNVYSPKLQQFTHYYHIPENDLSISGRTVTALVEEGESIWVGTKEKGLNRLNLKSGRIQKYNTNTRPTLISNRISGLLWNNQKLWIMHWAGLGFSSFDPQKKQFQTYRIDPYSTNIDWYHQVISWKNKEVLLAVWGGYGIYGLAQNSHKIENIGEDLVVIPNEKPISILNTENDSIWWLGGEDSGIRFYLPSQNSFYTARNLFPHKTPGFMDMQRMKDYNYIQADIPEFERILQSFNSGDTVFFVTDQYTIFYHYRQKTFGFRAVENRDLQTSLNHSINFLDFENKTGKKLIDMVETDRQIFTISNQNIFVYDSVKLNFKETPLQFLTPIDLENVQFQNLKANTNYLIIGTNKGLITIFKKQMQARFIRTRSREFMGYPVHLATCIAPGNQNDFWVGTTSTGISRWFPEQDKIINYISDVFDTTAFWGWDVTFVYRDSKNRIWAGGNGLHLYNEEEDHFIHYTTEQGLPSNYILGMTEDASGRLWLNTDEGLSCFHTNEETFINYGEAVGLPHKEMTEAIISLKNGKIAAGLKNGFTIFHPDSLIANYYIPPVLLTTFEVINGPVFQDLCQTDTIVLLPDENHISFSFASLDFNSPNDNNYQYILEGVDREWLRTDSKSRKINYSNLSPGTYHLKLRGSNNNDIWNNNGKSLVLIIKPHFYEQWWFYVLIASVIIFGIIMVVIYRIRELKMQSKTAQMEQRFLRSQMNPHFIFNSLGAIQNYIFKNEPLEAATYLSDFSNLVRMILNNSRQDLIPLEEEVKTLKQYLDLQKLRFQHKFDYQLSVDEPLNEMDYKIPPMLAQPFIENSIEHAFNGMKEKGLISIDFKLKGDTIHLICQDNGMGIQESLKQKKEGGKKHESLATKITHDRIRVLNKVYQSDIKLNLSDLSQTGENLKGTLVEIEIPIHLKKK